MPLPLKSALVLIVISASIYGAAPTLTPQGAGLGFTITTVVSPMIMPLGITIASNGNIIVHENGTNTTYVFLDVDGQTKAAAVASAASVSGGNGYATSGGKPYGGDGLGNFVQFNDDGTINHVLTGVTPPNGPWTGMWTNPVNGHLIAGANANGTNPAGTRELIDIDPLANGGLGSFRIILAPASPAPDGVAVSPDGKTVYTGRESFPGPNTNTPIIGYDIATGAVVYTSPNFPSPDGVGVLGACANSVLNGQVVVNDNNGNLYLLDPATNNVVTLATGAQRGDYVSPDTNNGTLLLVNLDTVYRLTSATCTFVGPLVLRGGALLGYQTHLDPPDGLINLTNSGATGAFGISTNPGQTAGNLCANVYVFDPQEELIACCSCLVTPNGLNSLSARNDLISNTLTPSEPDSITEMIVATTPLVGNPTPGGTANNYVVCNPSAPVTNIAGGGTIAPTVATSLLGWTTNLHSGPGGGLAVTEFPLRRTDLGGAEFNQLQAFCRFNQINGTGFGVCKSCINNGRGAGRK